MKILIVGSGAREHAIGDKIYEEHNEHELYFLPGNGGTSQIGKNIEGVSVSDFKQIHDYILSEDIQFVIIGPEQPLIEGMADYLRANGVITFGPNANAAAIEGDKAFSKYIMTRGGIPTAAYKKFKREEKEAAIEYLATSDYPVVIKATGPAAGKGVIIPENFNDAQKTIEDIFIKDIFGSSGDEIIIEEFMTGEEASIFAVTDGEKFVILPAAQDHKRIGEGDTGKNTGGMGAFAPAKIVTPAVLEEIKTKIIAPTLKSMAAEGKPFSGCLYAGLMLTPQGPKVVEFNCRFGDPETQSVLQTFSGDFLQMLIDASSNGLKGEYIHANGVVSATVVAASGGYPDAFEKGLKISGLDDTTQEVKIFHAGTIQKEGKIYTSGGRVLGITSIDKTGSLNNAIAKCYNRIDSVAFRGMYYRKDIAHKGLRHEGE